MLNKNILAQIEQLWGTREIDLFADRLTTQKSKYISWKPDPDALATDAFSQTWTTMSAYTFPPFCLIGRCLAKIKKDQAQITLITPVWPAQPWYPTILEFNSSNTVATIKKPTPVSTGTRTPTGGNGGPYPGGMDGVRQRLRTQGFSEQSSELLLEARRPGTQNAYAGPWKKWCGWCGTKQIDPFQATVGDVANFLTEQLGKGLQYSTLNCYRSAISAYHPEIDGHKAGQHPLIIQLLKGAFNRKPPQPRYTDTWDVDVVLKYLKTMGDNDSLSRKDPTLKLVMLLALVTVSRSSELNKLNPELMVVSGNEITFHIDKLTKTKRPNKPHFFVKICLLKMNNWTQLLV